MEKGSIDINNLEDLSIICYIGSFSSKILFLLQSRIMFSVSEKWVLCCALI